MIGHNKHQNDNPQPHNLQPVTLSPLNIKHASAFTRLAAAQAAYHHLHSYGVKYSPVRTWVRTYVPLYRSGRRAAAAMSAALGWGYSVLYTTVQRPPGRRCPRHVKDRGSSIASSCVFLQTH
jgi:hypothetical protein